MDYVEIEVKAKTVDLADEAAMQELGVTEKEQVAVQIVTEPVKGFLGMGGTDAIVRVKKKPSRKRRNRRKRGERGSGNREKSQKPRQSRGNGGKNGGKRADKKPTHQQPAGKHVRTEPNMSDDRPSLALDEQAKVTREFLEGLVDAYGLEGNVVTEVEDDIIIANVTINSGQTVNCTAGTITHG